MRRISHCQIRCGEARIITDQLGPAGVSCSSRAAYIRTLPGRYRRNQRHARGEGKIARAVPHKKTGRRSSPLISNQINIDLTGDFAILEHFAFTAFAFANRLEGNFCVLRTVWPTCCFTTAKRKCRIRRITNRPLTHTVTQRQNCCRISTNQWRRL